MDKDPKEIWREVLSKIQLTISKAHFKTWFSNSQLISLDDNSAIVAVRNKIARDYFENEFNEMILNSFFQLTGKNIKLKIKIKREEVIEEEKNKLPLFQNEDLFEIDNLEEKYNKAIGELGINKKYIFENFIVGSSNRLAHAAAFAVAENPGTAYNPLFIYGNVGLGKTHLLQAIANSILKRNPLFRIVYCSSEVFLNEMISSIRSGNSEQFRKKYREKDLLIIDDIQFIESKKGTQEEIFHTFNSMYQYNKQIVIASDRPPEDMPFLEARLRSRFEGGMVVDVNEPDYEMRLAILQNKAEEKGYKINENVLKLIAEKFTNNIRELEGILTKIGSLNIIGKEIVNEEDALQILGEKFTKKNLRIKPNDIINTVCNNFDITMKEIKGPTRTNRIAFPRQIAMYILRKELQMPFLEIAQTLNRKDHTTVIHAVDKIETLKHRDSGVRIQLEDIVKVLKS